MSLFGFRPSNVPVALTACRSSRRALAPVWAFVLAGLCIAGCKKSEPETAVQAPAENKSGQLSAGSLDTSAVLNFLSSLGLSTGSKDKDKDKDASSAKAEQFNSELAHWKQRALAEFPELGKAGSGFNKRFLESYNQLKAADAPELKLPNWPYLLAVKVSAFSEAEKVAALRKVAALSTSAPQSTTASPSTSVPPPAVTAFKPLPATVPLTDAKPQPPAPPPVFQPQAPSNAQPAGGIVLEKVWATAMKDGVLVMNELRDLIGSNAKPAANLGPAPGIDIYQGVRYLMPLKEAVKVLGLTQEVSANKPVVCPGFPYLSTFSHSFNGSFEDGFNTVYIVTDRAKQVVAIQFGSVAPKTRPRQTRGQCFDFVNTRTKALTTNSVGHETRGNGTDVLVIESVLYDVDRPKHSTRLYLPMPLMELILFRCQATK